MPERRFGATYSPDLTTFSVWGPSQDRVQLKLRHLEPIDMQKTDDGWHEIALHCEPGQQYQYIVGDTMIVDPAATSQSNTRVRSWSVVTDPDAYSWRNPDWKGRPWHEVIVYEAHPGLCGGFEGLRERLNDLVGLGFTALELMPIAQFPGNWNWGYDGVLAFAPDRSYGTPEDLKRLVDEAHGLGMMVFLDVVYNHFGPDGNYLPMLSPEFFRDDLHTPWGSAIDFRRPEVRQFFTENAEAWINEFRFDGLRFDAVHAIEDEGWLVEMAADVRASVGDRHVHLVLENDDNIADLLRTGFNAQWNDDYHHVLHVLLTDERAAYYEDYADEPAARLARALKEGFIYQGDPSKFRKNVKRGTPSADLPPTAFVNFLQNHDQIGNRAFGERLTTLTDPDNLTAAVSLLLLSPNIPLVFMGEEIGSEAPFHYFVDHSPELIEAIRAGRKKEFQGLVAGGLDELPVPNEQATFDNSRPEGEAPDADRWREFYRILLRLRTQRIVPHLPGSRAVMAEAIGPRAVLARWRLGNGAVLTIATNFSSIPTSGDFPTEKPFWGYLKEGKLPRSTTTAWLVHSG